MTIKQRDQVADDYEYRFESAAKYVVAIETDTLQQKLSILTVPTFWDWCVPLV
jgi:hypothetical protein